MAELQLTPVGDILVDNLVDPAPIANRGAGARGLRVGAQGLKAAAGGLLQLAGRGVGARTLEATGQRMNEEAQAAAAPDAMRVEDVASFGDAFDFGKFALGSAAPSILASIIGGVAGRATGALATKGAKEATRAIAKDAGTIAGLAATSTGLETGSIYPEALETGVDNPEVRAVGGGLAAGALDSLLPAILARRLLGGARPAVTGFGARARRAATEGASAAVTEGATETAQTAIERVAAGKDLTSPEAQSELLNAGVIGAIGGGGIGGAAGAVNLGARSAPQPQSNLTAEVPPAAPQPLPTINSSGEIDQTASDVGLLSSIPSSLDPAPPTGVTPVGTVPDYYDRHQSLLADEADQTRLNLVDGQRSVAEERYNALTEEVKNPASTAPKGELIAAQKAALDEVTALTAEAEGLNRAIKNRLAAQSLPEMSERTARTGPVAQPDLIDTNPAETAVAQIKRGLSAGKNSEAARRKEAAATQSAQLQEDIRLLDEAERTTKNDRLLTDIRTERTRLQEQLGNVMAAESSVSDIKNRMGGLVSSREASLVPKVDGENVSFIVPESRTPREVVKQVNDKSRQEAVEGVAVESIKRHSEELSAAGAFRKGAGLKTRDAVIQAAVEAAKAPTIEQAQKEVFDAAIKALGGNVNKQDAETFAAAVSADIGNAPTFYSKAAVGTASDPGIPGKVSVPLSADEQGFFAQIFQNPNDLSELQEAAPSARFEGGKLIVDPADMPTLEEYVSSMWGAVKKQYGGEGAKSIPKSFASAGHKFILKMRSAPVGVDLASKAAVAARVDFRDAVLTRRGQQALARLETMLGNDPNLEVKLYNAPEGAPAGSYQRMQAYKDVISLAVNAQDVLSVADHEGFHYLEARVLNGAERTVISRSFQPNARLYKQVLDRAIAYDRDFGTNIADEIRSRPQEARAYGYQFWRDGTLQADGLLSRAFEKIKQVLDRIANFVKGAGFTSTEDIFRAIELGNYANRKRREGGTGNQKSQAATKVPQTETAAFKKWFGDSKVVKDGKPRKVYHGSRADFETFDLNAMGSGHDLGYFADGFYFAGKPDSASSYAGQGAVYPVYLSMQKPYKWEGGYAERIKEALRFGGVRGAANAVVGRSDPGNNFYGRNVFGAVATGTRLPNDLHDAVLKRAGITDAELQQATLFSMHKRATQAMIDAAQGGAQDQSIYERDKAASEAMRTEYQKRLVRAVREELTERGYDGIIVNNPKTTANYDEYVVFKPTQIKSAVGNDGSFDGTKPSILYSRAATAEMERRERAGELEREQLYANTAALVDQANAPAPTFKEVFGATQDQFAGGLKRWRLENLATGNYIASKSNAYANVQKVLRSYIQMKSSLITDGARVKLSEWHSDASNADMQDTAKALMQRTVAGAPVGSEQYQQIRGSLTPKQQRMFDQANTMIAERLQQEFEAEQPGMQQSLPPEDYAEWFENRQTQIKKLVQEGYVPERRYGDHTVHIYLPRTDAKGKQENLTVFYEQFESEGEARMMAKRYTEQMAEKAPELKVDYGYKHKVERDTSMGMQQFMDTARRNGIELTQEERERIAKALVAADSTRRNRMFRRKNVPGFSEDAMRVLHEFVVNTSNKIAYTSFADGLNSAAQGRPVESRVESGTPTVAVDKTRDMWREDGPESGFYRNLSDELIDYVLVPDHSGQWSTKLRGAAMLYFLGGSFASGAVNMMSMPMNTLPWLTQYTDYGNAFSKTTGAWTTTMKNSVALRDINKLKDAEVQLPGIDAQMRSALVQAAEDGTTQDTEIHQIMGLSQGGMFAKSRKVQKAMEVWMWPFRFAEQTNRIATFMAAYNVGRDNGLANRELYEFAKGVVDNTQNRYDEANRPGAARDPFWGMMFMFKSFPLFVTEMVETMYKQNPKSAVYFLMGLTAMAGINGLPFAEDIMDLVDTISQKLFGSPFNSRRAMRNILKDASETVTGIDMSDILLRGVANDMADLNIASRIGMGDIIPGSRIGAADTDYGRVAEEVLGAPMSMVSSVGGGAAKVLKGDFMGALRDNGPSAIRNVIKSGEQLDRGFAVDGQGRKLIDVSGPQVFWQALGFSSASLSKMYDLDRIDKQTESFYVQVRNDMTSKLVKAMRDGDAEGAQEVYSAMNEWNNLHPDMPIALSPATLRKRVVDAGLPLNERTLRNLPRALRGTSTADGF